MRGSIKHRSQFLGFKPPPEQTCRSSFTAGLVAQGFAKPGMDTERAVIPTSPFVDESFYFMNVGNLAFVLPTHRKFGLN